MTGDLTGDLLARRFHALVAQIFNLSVSHEIVARHADF